MLPLAPFALSTKGVASSLATGVPVSVGVVILTAGGAQLAELGSEDVALLAAELELLLEEEDEEPAELCALEDELLETCGAYEQYLRVPGRGSVPKVATLHDTGAVMVR